VNTLATSTENSRAFQRISACAGIAAPILFFSISMVALFDRLLAIVAGAWYVIFGYKLRTAVRTETSRDKWLIAVPEPRRGATQ
jgi:hypothetical protein